MIDTNSAPGAAVELIAPDAAALQQTPGEEAPQETKIEQEQADPEAEAKAERDKAIRNLQRRVDRKHAQAAAAEERARLAEQRAADLEARFSGGETQQRPEQPAVDPYRLADQIATVREVNHKSERVVNEGQKRFGSDFGASVRTCVEEAGPLFQDNGLPTAFGEAVLDADDPAALLHHLGQETDLASELNGMRPTQLARRLAQIEAELKAPKQPKQSTAPKPVSPVKPSADAGGLNDTLSPDEWRRRFYKMRAEGRH
jgi:hypothetical protein